MNKKIYLIVFGILVLLVGSLFILKAGGVPYYKLLSDRLNGIVSASQEEINSEVTRTASTQTVCNDNGKCTLTLYSGVRYAYEDEIWKEVEKARSLKDAWDVVYLEDDGDHKIDVLDYNYTSIALDFSFIGDAEE